MKSEGTSYGDFRDHVFRVKTLNLLLHLLSSPLLVGRPVSR
jgi:hypothetical protein